ncbi:MAG: hypothetical protein QN198_09770 [Armatimonadota bacterium]|nr:hypothetical protein [Armatimonadota bacterium]
MLARRFFLDQFLQPFAYFLIEEGSWSPWGAVIKGFLSFLLKPLGYVVDRGTRTVEHAGNLSRRKPICQQQDDVHPQSSGGLVSLFIWEINLFLS